RGRQVVLWVGLSANGQRALAAPWLAGPLSLWDTNTWQESQRSNLSQLRLPMTLSNDGRFFLHIISDNAVRLYDFDKGQDVRIFPIEKLAHLAFAPDGRHFLAGTLTGTVQWWDIDNGREDRHFTVHARVVTGLSVLPSGNRALSFGDDNTVR